MKNPDLEKSFARLRDELDRKIAKQNPALLYARIRQRIQTPALRRLLARLKRFEHQPEKIRLTDRKDLLLLLFYAPGRTGRFAEPLLGMTRITKLLFLALAELNLKKLTRTTYRFQPYKLGPFAPELYDDLEILIQAGLIQAVSLQPDGIPVIRTDARTIQLLNRLNSGITAAERLDAAQLLLELTPRGRRLARALFQIATRRQKNLAAGLKIIKTQFGSLPLTQLLRYVYTRYPEYTTRSEILDRIIKNRTTLTRPDDNSNLTFKKI
ncbi:MAG: hypothetical protein ACP5JB_08065 [candidate division WOR-3 bacterium]